MSASVDALTTDSNSALGASVEDYHAAPPPDGPARWYGAGEVVTVHGITISSPMVYVGTALLSAAGGNEDPSYIDPKLPVDAGASLDVHGLGVVCSYQGFTNSQRLAYLRWLADGREAIAPKEFLIVFFYGVERRIVLDGNRLPDAHLEWPVLIAEINRLVALHDNQRTEFHSLANALVSWLTLLEEDPPTRRGLLAKPIALRDELAVKVALGRLAAARECVPAWLALAWVMKGSSFIRRAPMDLYPTLFGHHFKRAFAHEFVAGIWLPSDAPVFTHRYQVASPGVAIGGDLEVPFPGVLDTTGAVDVVDALQILADRVAGELNGYHRAVGTGKYSECSLEAVAALPPALWPRLQKPGCALAVLEKRVRDGLFTLTLGDAIAMFSAEGVPSRDKLRAWAAGLEYFGIAMEPDIIGTPRIPSADDPVTFFALNWPLGDERIPPPLATALLVLDIAMTVACAGEGAKEAALPVLSQVKEWPGLQPSHRTRLAARMQCCLLKAPSWSALKRRVAEISAADRTEFARIALSAAGQDRVVSAARTGVLQKVQKLLALDEKSLFSQLHEKSTGADPKARGGATADFALDEARIDSLNKDSDGIAGLLSSIFTEEDAVELALSIPPVPLATTKTGQILGLDEKHGGLARAVIEQPAWSRDEFVALAGRYGLYPDGALDVLNDAAFDLHGAMLLEGDDPLEVNPEIVELL